MELTHEQLATLKAGTELHFTNHPCRPSVLVVLIRDGDSEVRFADGRTLYAFVDELSTTPRSGLGQD